jgi:hypothetical protein
MYESKIIDPTLSAQENWERICKHRNIDPTALPDASKCEEKHRKFIESSYKLAIATETINEEHTAGWFADYQKENYKTEPWFHIKGTDDKPRGAGFSASFYVHWCTASDCGSRLASPDSGVTRLLQAAFKQDFENVWIIPS